MAQLFGDECRDEPTWRVCARSLVDLAITVTAQHLEVHVHRSPAAVVSTMYLTVAAAGAPLAAVGGTNRTSLVIGLIMTFGAGFIAVAARRGAEPAPRGAAKERRWQFIIAGPVLIGAVILAAGLGVEALFLGIARGGLPRHRRPRPWRRSAVRPAIGASRRMSKEKEAAR